jgi:nucleotide sugar dehydrogenase
MKIGIVGQGYVGTAVRTVFEKHYDVHTYDIKEKCTETDMNGLVQVSDIIFVCEIDEISYDDYVDDGKIVAIKSTIPPGTTNDLNKECKNISVIFNPEFLTEANFIDDFKNQNRIIIGGSRPATTTLRQVYSLVFPEATIVKTGSITAEMVKYLTNTFLATKVSFANEMKIVCDELGIDYDKVVEYATYDERLGKSHWAVPGPDGKLGFGGSCFPKDINALVHICKEMNIPINVISSAIDTNLMVRPEKDWEELKGRAVVEEK